MTYKGYVKDGQVISDERLDLPDGTQVEIRLLDSSKRPHHPDVERFAGILAPETGDERAYVEHLRRKHA